MSPLLYLKELVALFLKPFSHVVTLVLSRSESNLVGIRYAGPKKVGFTKR